MHSAFAEASADAPARSEAECVPHPGNLFSAPLTPLPCEGHESCAHPIARPRRRKLIDRESLPKQGATAQDIGAARFSIGREIDLPYREDRGTPPRTERRAATWQSQSAPPVVGILLLRSRCTASLAARAAFSPCNRRSRRKSSSTCTRSRRRKRRTILQSRSRASAGPMSSLSIEWRPK